jgi:RNA polymerase sigma-70 factor (ECF subfamily)
VSDPTARLLALLDEQGPRLYRLLTRLTLRHDVAEDLLQELFLKLRAAPGFLHADRPAAYACSAAVRLAFDWRRRQARRGVETGLPDLPSAEPPALSDLVLREEVEQVLASLDDLPELARTCLVLRYLEEEPYDAIARTLGKTPHQVRALCHKALAALRRRFGSVPPGEEEIVR